MKAAAIPSSWLRWAGTWDASFLLRVQEIVSARGIARDDEQAVRAVMQECGGRAMKPRPDRRLKARRVMP